MVKDLSPTKIYEFITGDFEDAWKSLASNAEAQSRGNFMFALQGMILLELGCRLCGDDRYEKFFAALEKRNSRYFVGLPDKAKSPPDDLRIPAFNGVDAKKQLLWWLFDLIRNGQAHQYQQLIVKLADSHTFAVQLCGASAGRKLRTSSPKHLVCQKDGEGDLLLHVCPDVLFSDVKAAIEEAQLVHSEGLALKMKPRKMKAAKADLAASLSCYPKLRD